MEKESQSAFSAPELSSEEELNQYREHLEILFNSSSDNFILLDCHANLVLFNKGFHRFAKEMTGVTPKPGMSLYEVTPPSRKPDNEEIFARVLQGETVQSIGQIQAGGESHYYDIRYHPVFHGDEVKYVTISALDITEQKRLEMIARKHAENLDIIINNTTDHFELIDASGVLIFFNKAYERSIHSLLGVTPKIGMHYLDLVAPHRRPFAKEFFDRVIGGEVIHTIAEIQTSLGTRIFELHIQPITKEGVVTHISRAATDITEKVAQEKTINQFRKNLEIIFENSSDYFLLLDANANVIFFNNKFAEFTRLAFGVEAKKGMKFMEVVAPNRHEVAQSIFDRVIQGKPETVEAEFSLPTGHIWFSIRYTPVSSGQKVTHVCSVATDITERKMQEIELNESKLSLEIKVIQRTADLNKALQQEREHVEMKSKFVSMASHEFRTPLATISLASEFVRKYSDRVPPEMRDRKLDTIVRQVEHMTHLLDKVLTIGKSDARKSPPHLSALEVRPYFESLVAEVVNSEYHTQAINLEVNGTANTFISDEELIRNIFINLLTNAIKFSGESNGVDLHIVNDELKLTAIVRDHGIGIPKEDLPRLFEPFFRAQNALNIGGTGLGLSIVKKAVEELHGELTLETEVGKGTSFTVVLPRLR